MNYKLNTEQDWRELAQQANWSVDKLAKLCGVSVRTLERFFIRKMCKTPMKWLNQERQEKMFTLLNSGASIKEVSLNLGYKYATNFTRQFKKQWGKSPKLKRTHVFFQTKLHGHNHYAKNPKPRRACLVSEND